MEAECSCRECDGEKRGPAVGLKLCNNLERSCLAMLFNSELH